MNPEWQPSLWSLLIPEACTRLKGFCQHLCRVRCALESSVGQREPSWSHDRACGQLTWWAPQPQAFKPTAARETWADIWSTSQVMPQGRFSPGCSVSADATGCAFKPPDFRRCTLREQQQVPLISKTPLAFITLGKIKFAPE